MTTIIARISQLLQAMENCERSNNTKWLDIWSRELDGIEAMLPSGSGFDAGTKIQRDMCKNDKIVFFTQFHHMDEHGGYAGWTQHYVIASPAFDGFDLKVTRRDRNRIKEYIGEIFHDVLLQPYVKPEAGEKDA